MIKNCMRNEWQLRYASSQTNYWSAQPLIKITGRSYSGIQLKYYYLISDLFNFHFEHQIH